MRLLVFCPHYPPYVGGLETHAAEFNKYLSQSEEVDSILVFTSRIPVSIVEQSEVSKKVRIIRFPAFHLIPNYPVPKVWLPTYWRLWRQLYRYNPDIVISRTRFFFTSVLALSFTKMYRKPWVHIEHGSDYFKLSILFFSLLIYYY